MDKIYKDERQYFLEELNNGRTIKTLLMSHNASWPPVMVYRDKYKNYKVDIHGGSLSYLNLNNVINNDYDFIIFFSSDFYEEEDYIALKKLTYEISQKENKRVSMGYSYMIPFEQRTEKEQSEQIKIVSVKNCSETEEVTYPTTSAYFDLLDLIGMTTIFHDNVEQQINKCLKKL